MYTVLLGLLCPDAPRTAPDMAHGLALLWTPGASVKLDRMYSGRGCVSLPLDQGAATPPAPAPRRRPLKLKMDIPLVTLDEADRQNLRAALVTALGGPASASALVSPADPHAPRPVSAPPAEDALMQTHLHMMSQLAAVHEEVMQAALGSGQID